MHVPTFLSIVLATTSASACTFAMTSKNYANTGDGSGGNGCRVVIYKDDLSKDDIGTARSDFSEDGTCSKGCDTVEYNGKKWEFCHSILSPFKAEVTDNTYVSVKQLDNNGNTLSIYPDGDFKSFSSYSPFNSYLENDFFRSNIAC